MGGKGWSAQSWRFAARVFWPADRTISDKEHLVDENGNRVEKDFRVRLLSASFGTIVVPARQQNPSTAPVPGPVPGPGWQPPAPGNQPLAAPGSAPLLDAFTPDEQVNICVYQQVNRSVVNINTRGVSGDRFLLFEIVSEGEGSGTVIDRDGPRVDQLPRRRRGPQKIQVTLYDGQTYDAQLVGGDPDTDVAVLKIDAPAESLFPVGLRQFD